MYIINIIALMTILINTVLIIGIWSHQRKNK